MPLAIKANLEIVSRCEAPKGSQQGFPKHIEMYRKSIPTYPGEVPSGSHGFAKRAPTKYRKSIPMYTGEVPSGSQGFPKRITAMYRTCIPMYPGEVPSGSQGFPKLFPQCIENVSNVSQGGALWEPRVPKKDSHNV